MNIKCFFSGGGESQGGGESEGEGGCPAFSIGIRVRIMVRVVKERAGSG